MATTSPRGRSLPGAGPDVYIGATVHPLSRNATRALGGDTTPSVVCCPLPLILWSALIASLLGTAAAGAQTPFVFELQRRDPVTSEVLPFQETVDPRHVAVVAIDLWNWHWCKTSTQRVGALIPRINRCLASARALGMTVFLCPTDVADNYVGTPMVERMIATDPIPLPQGVEPQCPPAPDGGGCTCGVERCQGNYGWDGMHPDLVIGPDDLMPNDPGRLYAVCRQRGITHLIYVGVHTQVCLLGKSVGLRAMTRAGLKCFLARDLTDAHGRYEPGVETPDDFTKKVVAHFEKHLAATLDFGATLRRNGHWPDNGPVDLVRHAPWGTTTRPHLFEHHLVVTLTQPGLPKAVIRYTLDGTDPNPSSSAFGAPLTFTNGFRLRAAAFNGTKRITRISESFAARLPARPSMPEVFLGSVKPWRAVGMGHSPSFEDHRWSPGVNPPQEDRSNEGKSIRLRGREHAHGIGVHAPNQLVYDVDPAWERFVGLAGVDEHVLDVNSGSNRAMHPSVVFRVFVDGRLAGESPVMRISEEPWRFDIPLPAGTRRISLAATDAGDGHEGDLANWADAGFVKRR